MFEVITYAENFLEVIRSLGEWLTATYFTFPAYNIYEGVWTTVHVPLPFDWNIAELILGPGLTSVLAIKLWGFFQ